MQIFSKIILFFLGISALLLLLVTTFSGSRQEVLHNFNLETLTQSGVALSYPDGDKDVGVAIHHISPLDTLFSYSKEATFTLTGDTNERIIELDEGEFFIDIHDINTRYIIKNEYFQLELAGFGKVYIDTRDLNKYNIISLNNIVSLDLKKTGSDDILTQISLYPHMGIRFSTKRNKFLKNADLVRISSVNSLDYYVTSFFSPNQERKFSIFLETVLDFEKEENKQRKQNIQELMSVSLWSFPGEKYIKQYYSVFINDSKKKEYYKNAVLGNIIDILHTKEQDNQLITETKESFERLKQYPEAYKYMVDVLSVIRKEILYGYKKDHIYAKINISRLSSKIGEERVPIDSSVESLYFLESLYSTFDFEQVYLYENLAIFFNKYLSNIASSELKGEEKRVKNVGQIEYFSFFLENIIASRFLASSSGSSDLSSQGNLGNILGMMNELITLNLKLYLNKGENKAITLMYRYIEVLSSMEVFVRGAYFESEISKEGLLLRKKSEKLSRNNLVLLERNITSILDFYKKNEKFLDTPKQRDVFMVKKYKEFDQKFREYFSALENYDSYVYSYDESKKKLLEISTAGEGGEQVLSKSNAIGYISQFHSLSLQSIDVQVIEERYYKISGIFLKGKELSFFLYPFSDNKIDNIILDDKKVSVLYKLDNIEEEWSEKARGVGTDEKNIYDFSRFFLNTFILKEKQEQEIYENDRKIESEDTVIVVFKRDKLLGEKGEFSSLKNILEIQYDNLEVIPQRDTYSISIQRADLTIEGTDAKGKSFDFPTEFSSNYIFTDKKHQFRNIQLRPYRSNGLGNTIYDLGGNNISFIGSLDLRDFKENMVSFGEDFPTIRSVYTDILRDLGVENMSIKYSLFNRKTILRFDYNGDNIIITILGDRVEDVSKGGESMGNTPIASSSFRHIVYILKNK